MYSLAFAGLFGFDDLIRISRSDLFFHPDHLKIFITKSKNDQLCKGNVVLISDSPSETSSVQLIKLYLSRLQIPYDCNKFIFRPSVKSNLSVVLLLLTDISVIVLLESISNPIYLESSTIRQSLAPIPCVLVVVLEQQTQVLKNVSL